MNFVRWLWSSSWFRLGAAPALLVSLIVVGNSDKARSAIERTLRDPFALLDGRSPGNRDPGALFQTKLAYARNHPASVGPRQRVLSTERVRPPLAGGAPFGDTPLGGPSSTFGPFGDALPDISGGGPPSLIGNTAPPFIGGGASPANAATPTPLPTTSLPTTPLLDATSPVPEPETWGLLLIGIATVGATLRRRSAIQRSTDARTASKAIGIAR